MPENRQMSDADTQPLLPELALPRDAQSGVWPAQRLKAALARGEIQTIEPLDSQQVQPASIDLRLGPVAYEIAASFLPGPQLTVQDKLPLVTQRKISLENGAVLKTGHVYLVPLLEKLQLRKRSSGVANPKSSTGRLDVFCRVITDYGVEFDQIPERYTGPLWLEIAPRSFHVKVRQGSRLSQLRLKTGTPPSSNAFIRRLDEEVRIVRDEDGPANVKDGAIALSVDISASGGSDLIGYKARKVSEEIDIDKIGHYDVDTFWERVYRPREGGLILHPDEFHILATKEKVAVPDYLAADMVA
ncbi:MAG TPA: 2'-deoxycytidine 5'-triphosphate deaminase, partial [Alphaproteobacteria bacterium]|nr:2'-deoxycytidine 5'-triphosphate deaminase [Alphaproteobacteria bacterium]